MRTPTLKRLATKMSSSPNTPNSMGQCAITMCGDDEEPDVEICKNKHLMHSTCFKKFLSANLEKLAYQNVPHLDCPVCRSTCNLQLPVATSTFLWFIREACDKGSRFGRERDAAKKALGKAMISIEMLCRVISHGTIDFEIVAPTSEHTHTIDDYIEQE